MSGSNLAAAEPRRGKVTEVEQHGIDTIPAAHRSSGPLDLFRIQFGGANTFATIILGTFPVLLGLSLWQAVAATVAGVVVGALILMPMGLFGPRTGTNNAVSSSAHFGVRGRILGSFLSLLTAIAFYSISVWVSGDALAGALNRLFDVPDNDGTRGVLYAVLGALVIVVVVYGYQFMLLVNKVVVVANTALMLLGIVAYASVFQFDYTPGFDYALGSFWPTFVLSALIVMGNPISFGAFLGDWSRYIPDGTPVPKLLAATFTAQLATLVPFLFGVATATIVSGEADYVFARRRLSGGNVDGRHVPVRHRPRLLIRLPAVEPSTGFAVHRRLGLRLHPGRTTGVRPDRRSERLHRGDSDLHDAMDDHHDDRLHRPARLLLTARRPGVQRGQSRWHLLVLRGNQLARHLGLGPRGRHRFDVRQLPSAHLGPVPQQRRRSRHQSPRHVGACRDHLPRPVVRRAGASLRVRTGWATLRTGARLGTAADHRQPERLGPAAAQACRGDTRQRWLNEPELVPVPAHRQGAQMR
jgi:hypothetical protein